MKGNHSVLGLVAALAVGVSVPAAGVQAGPDKEILELKERIKALESEVRELRKVIPGRTAANQDDAAGGLSNDCQIKASQFPGDSMAAASDAGWTYFVSQQKEHGNYVQVCLNGPHQQMFNAHGLLLKVLDTEHELILQTVVPEDFVDPALLGKSWKLVAGRIEGEKVKAKAAGLYVYRILKTSLAPAAFKAVAEHGTAPIDKVARVKADLVPQDPDSVRRLTVFLREAVTPEKGVELVSAVLKELPGTPIGEDKHAKVLLSFVRDEVAKAKGKPDADASLTMVTYKAGELAATGKETDTVDNYKEIIPAMRLSAGFAHSDKLIYCGVTGGLETLSAHAKKGHIPK